MCNVPPLELPPCAACLPRSLTGLHVSTFQPLYAGHEKTSQIEDLICLVGFGDALTSKEVSHFRVGNRRQITESWMEIIKKTRHMSYIVNFIVSYDPHAAQTSRPQGTRTDDKEPFFWLKNMSSGQMCLSDCKHHLCRCCCYDYLS